MGVLALWESGHRGPVPVPVLVGVPAPTRPNTDQMREEAGRYQRRSAVVQERRPKPRRAAMGNAKAQTQVPTPADKNARTSKKTNQLEQRPNPAKKITWPGPRAGWESGRRKACGQGAARGVSHNIQELSGWAGVKATKRPQRRGERGGASKGEDGYTGTTLAGTAAYGGGLYGGGRK